MYAIKNQKTKKWLYGTDYTTGRQRTAVDKVKIYGSRLDAELDLKVRKCGKDYIVVKVRIEEEK